MKKMLNIALPLMALLFFSCSPVEPEYTEENYFYDIYTVYKHSVSPEFSDSTIPVSNMEKYGFETGDRADMVLRYYYDYQTTPRPVFTIHSVREVIKTRPLSQTGSIDAAEYNTPFDSLVLYEFYDRRVLPIWVWKNRLNMNISYFGEKSSASFAMTVRGVSGDTVMFDLYAKAPRNGSKTSTSLLTFDLNSVADVLTAEQKNSLAGIDTLNTKVYFQREVKGKVREAFLTRARFANPVR